MPRTRTVSRFTATPGEIGSSILTGYRDAGPEKYDKDFVKRNVAPYKKYGLTQKVSDLEGKSDTKLYDMAARAVLRKFKATDGDKKPGGKAKPPARRPRPRVTAPPRRSSGPSAAEIARRHRQRERERARAAQEAKERRRRRRRAASTPKGYQPPTTSRSQYL